MTGSPDMRVQSGWFQWNCSFHVCRSNSTSRFFRGRRIRRSRRAAAAVQRHQKTRRHRHGWPGFFLQKRRSLAVSSTPGCSYPLPAKRFTLFAAAVFAWFFVAFFKLQALEKTVILNFFLQNTHSFFKIVVLNFDRNFLQPVSPLSFHSRANRGWLVTAAFAALVNKVI